MRSFREISCIIPFWNEDRNLNVVLDEITKAKNIDEIICVDDGSDEDKTASLKAEYPGIRIMRLEKNRGKSGAVREGLKYARGYYIFLLDADIRNLDHKQIDRALGVMKGKESVDMLILRRINAPFFIRFYRADVLFTGERILKKRDLETVFAGTVERWQLESAINTWMYLNGKSVFWMPHSGLNTQKFYKWGLLKGLRLDLKTFADMITATGFTNFARQLLFFARDELRLDAQLHQPANRKTQKVLETTQQGTL